MRRNLQIMQGMLVDLNAQQATGLRDPTGWENARIYISIIETSVLC